MDGAHAAFAAGDCLDCHQAHGSEFQFFMDPRSGAISNESSPPRSR